MSQPVNLIPQIAEKSSLISLRQEQAFVHSNHFISEDKMNNIHGKII
jgi:hypothetical protein